MKIDDILKSFIFLLKKGDIKSFDDLVTLKVDLNNILANEHIFVFRTLFSKMEKEIDEDDNPTLTICLSFIDNCKNVINEIVRKAGYNIKVESAISTEKNDALKISDDIQASLNAIKEIYKYKFDYEAIDFLCIVLLKI